MSPVDLAMESVLDLATLTARAAGRWGDRRALVFDQTGESFSFRGIEERSTRVAAALAGAGVRPGARVGLMLRNRPEFPLAWLGIVKAGAVMVPLNVHYKPLDARYLLDHAGVSTVVCEHDLAPVIEEAVPRLASGERIFTVGGEERRSFGALVEGAAASAPPVRVLPEDLANIQYTSGTTGHPKGCLLSNAWFLRFAWRVAIAQHGLGESDVLLSAQPFYYVDPQWTLAVSLLVGAELVVLDRFHPSSFWQKVNGYRVTWFYCLGVMPKLLLKMPESELDRSHRVRFVACSAIPPRDHRAIEERWGVPWYDVFGMTESGLDLGVTVEEHDELVGSGSIGRPMPTREARAVDADDRPVPRGEVGELVLRGPGLMDGYYRNPEATAEAFRNGWLHTGDLVRVDEGGRFYYVGRQKDMIRRSGENIAAAEVEEVIMQHEAVRLAACVPVPDDLRGEEVKAYVALQPGYDAASVGAEALAAFCLERIAYFKVPRYWAFVDDMPRTPSQRVVKTELVAGADDLRAGAFDRVDGCWR